MMPDHSLHHRCLPCPVPSMSGRVERRLSPGQQGLGSGLALWDGMLTRARDYLLVSGVDPASEFLDDL
jgi:hypothetical protein